MTTVLLTGATGYIASHTWISLAEAGFEVVGVDDFSNSSRRVLSRLEVLLGKAPTFVEADVTEAKALDAIFECHRPAAVVHFAAFKAVGESTQKPLDYYRNNLGGVIEVCAAMQRHGCGAFVFSSSATVYGDPDELPLKETARLSATNPYGRTKWVGEMICEDLRRASRDWHVAVLRYFNPVGAHTSGMIGEDPSGTPNNLMPYIAQVAVGRRQQVQVFGADYPTPDGTGVRDYIHVLDLAEGHVAALHYLLRERRSLTVNLGTGCGYTVLEVIRAYERASGKTIPFDIVARRPGDIAASYADATLAAELLDWRASRDLDAMCVDSWRWQSQNPRGFDDEPILPRA
jgi:UDP-glucose 4-epimerase